jgi:glycosyltransferase involved in cell wall biosynthesis
MRMATVSVLVPTYRRPQGLGRCLDAIANQTRPPDDVVVVVRDTDQETREYLAARKPDVMPVRLVSVHTPGLVAALNAGLDSIDTDLVACTDDDARPRPEWLTRIVDHFKVDSRVGAVGGRDWIPGSGPQGERRVVGRLQWWGRIIGNHHLGVGPARDVDVLKGVNMSYRCAAIADRRFDTRLLGAGSTVHNELGVTLALRRSGWRVIYDPAVAVDHDQAPRVDEGQRSDFSPAAVHDAVHNETLALLDHLPAGRRELFFLWALAVGTRAAPGLVQWVRFIAKGWPCPTQRLLASWQGRWHAWRRWRAHRRLSDSPVRASAAER